MECTVAEQLPKIPQIDAELGALRRKAALLTQLKRLLINDQRREEVASRLSARRHSQLQSVPGPS